MTTPDNPEAQTTDETPESAEALKGKLADMEAKVSMLEGELDSLRPEKIKTTPEIWASRLVLAMILLLAMIPPALVVADRWFSIPLNDLDNGRWCTVAFLCTSMLPPYFGIILWCFFLLALIFFYFRHQTIVVLENPLKLFENFQVGPQQMRVGFHLLVLSGLGMVGVFIWSFITQRWPSWDLVIVWLLYLSGWGLRAVPLTTLANFWKRDGDFWVSLLLMHVAIIVALVGYYDVPQVFYLSLVLLACAFVNLWRFRKRVPTIFWIISTALVFYTININAWWTAIVGDDYEFHDLAWTLAERMTFGQISNFLFQADGVFSTHPYFSSLIQAFSMRFLGHNSFGWRFSSLYLCAIGVGLFYFFCKSFLSRQAALIATCLLAFSHYVMSFGKIGYNNLQALFALSLVLVLAAWALRWKQPFVFALLGSAMAVCFYLYPVSLYVVPLPIVLLLIYDPPKSRPVIGRWLVMVAVCLAMIYPLMMQPIYWQTKQAGTLFNRPELIQSVGAIVQHFAYNIFYSILSFLYISEGHYVAVSFIDPITAVFIMLGYFVLLYQMRRQRFAIFTTLAFVLFLFLVGASHDREAPSTSRMFMMLPWFALFGTWGIMWLKESVKNTGFFVHSKNVLIVALLVAIAGTNLYQAYKIAPLRYAPVQSMASLFLAVTENIAKVQPDKQKTLAVIEKDTSGFKTMLYFQNVYPYVAWFHIEPITITEPNLSQDRITYLSDPDTIVLVTPYLDETWQNALDAPLAAMGKTRCEIWIPNTRNLMILYLPPNIPPQVCVFDTGLAIDEKIATQGP